MPLRTYVGVRRRYYWMPSNGTRVLWVFTKFCVKWTLLVIVGIVLFRAAFGS